MLILLIFLAELAAAILAFIFREHVSFLKSSPTFDHKSAVGLSVKTQGLRFLLFVLPDLTAANLNHDSENFF